VFFFIFATPTNHLLSLSFSPQGDFCRLLCYQQLILHPGSSLDDLVVHYREYMPEDIAMSLSELEWTDAMRTHFDEIPGNISTAEATRAWMELLQQTPHFGSRFFLLASVSDGRIKGPTLLAISHRGICFLDPKTRETLLEYSFGEIVSTRRLGSKQTGKHFVDFKVKCLHRHYPSS
jgi:hypothetical protein